MAWLSFIELDKAVVHVISTPAVTDLAEAWLRGATPHPRSGVVAERSYPTSEVRGSSQEELPYVRGKEQRLRFAGAAVKRCPTFKVRETQVRW